VVINFEGENLLWLTTIACEPMSASLMRARIATKILSGLYEDVPTLLTSAIRLMVELPAQSRAGRHIPLL